MPVSHQRVAEQGLLPTTTIEYNHRSYIIPPFPAPPFTRPDISSCDANPERREDKRGGGGMLDFVVVVVSLLPVQKVVLKLESFMNLVYLKEKNKKNFWRDKCSSSTEFN
jgi:hypothetical protein